MKRVMLLAIGAALLLPAAPAVAQTPSTEYPPGPCTAENTSQNLGTFQIGNTVTGPLTPSPCAFVPGSAVAMAVNGAGAGTKAANGSGGVFVSLQINSATSGLLNDPVTVPLRCGANTITASGQTLGGVTGQGGNITGGPTPNGPATVTGHFTVVCPGAAAAAPSAAGRVAFTGANILRWSMAAAALIAIGILFMLGSRRRRSGMGA